MSGRTLSANKVKHAKRSGPRNGNGQKVPKPYRADPFEERDVAITRAALIAKREGAWHK
jgi:hypothetical protein